MSGRLFLITGTTLAAFIGSLSTAEAQFGQRGFGRVQLDAPAPRAFLPKPNANKPRVIDAGKSNRIVVIPPIRDLPASRVGGGKKPPRGDQAGNDAPPTRTNPRPDRPPKTGDKKPPRRPPVVVVVPPIILDPPPGRDRPPRVVKPGTPPSVVVPPRLASPPMPPLRLLPPLPPVSPPLPGSPPPAVAQQAEFVPDELLITVPTAALQQLEMDLAQAFNVSILERVPLPLVDVRLVRLRIPDGRDVPSVVTAIAADPRVLLAQPNFFYWQSNEPVPAVQPASAPAALPGLQYALAKLGTEKAHLLAQGRGAKVAVIDSGIDQSHPDLAAAQIEHFDATETDSAVVAELDTHGTGIAGIIAARGTVQGVAPGSALMSARVFRKSNNAAGASATTVRVLKGITWSVEKGARVLNMSFAGPRDPLVERHVKAVANRGLISVAAAGNNGSSAPPAFPAAYDEVIAVTAIDSNDRLYEQANRGRYVAIAAPGVDIIVPAVGRTHHFQSGTSFAAAHVSGVIALLLEVRPDLTAPKLRELLAAASDDIGAPGHDSEFGAGRINAAKAVELAAK